MSRSRGFVFTINNYTDDDDVGLALLKAMSDYLVVGKETGDEGTPHYQGYVYFKTLKAFKQIKECIPRAHIEAAKGNALQNREYCTKQGDFEEFGECPKQGKRNDLEVAYQVVKETSKMKEVVALMPNFQAIKCAEAYLKYHEAPRDWKGGLYVPRQQQVLGGL